MKHSHNRCKPVFTRRTWFGSETFLSFLVNTAQLAVATLMFRIASQRFGLKMMQFQTSHPEVASVDQSARQSLTLRSASGTGVSLSPLTWTRLVQPGGSSFRLKPRLLRL